LEKESWEEKERGEDARKSGEALAEYPACVPSLNKKITSRERKEVRGRGEQEVQKRERMPRREGGVGDSKNNTVPILMRIKTA